MREADSERPVADRARHPLGRPRAVEERYSFGRMMNSYEEVYMEVLSR